jgi:limonene-1,2-epoxide hydrolase
MKKIFFAFTISLMVLGCNNDEKKEEAASSKNAEMKALYEKNLATLKAFVAAFEKEDTDALAAQIADTARWSSPAYGDTVTTKAHWMESLKYYLANWSNLHLTNGQFLPGVDSTTHEFDGSVRYYGRWDGVHTSGVTTQVKFYGTYEFNKDNKLISGSDFFDLGGLFNALQPKTK